MALIQQRASFLEAAGGRDKRGLKTKVIKLHNLASNVSSYNTQSDVHFYEFPIGGYKIVHLFFLFALYNIIQTKKLIE